eukprot:TRINITY_DN73462_c0_g1_i1.p1 TRINITY_DN73462_c0_g1~~TRINITY_DN73462_c0_g1_i1.p1  ORF type:complete len:175 (+),score=39.38 TRINITY_DN73462_c0_g1_i1:79-603(+)
MATGAMSQAAAAAAAAYAGDPDDDDDDISDSEFLEACLRAEAKNTNRQAASSPAGPSQPAGLPCAEERSRQLMVGSPSTLAPGQPGLKRPLDNNSLPQLAAAPVVVQERTVVVTVEKTVERKRECPICLDRDVDHAFDPCGHMTCGTCAELIKKNKPCPVCRKKVKKALQIFLP